MYYKLNENYLLRGWQKLPYAVVDKRRQRPIFINAKEMRAPGLGNGQMDLAHPSLRTRRRHCARARV